MNNNIMNYERLENGSNGLVLSASLDNLVFEGKNRSYGAYQMRMSDNRRLMSSFYFTAAVVLIITITLYMFQRGPQLPNEDFVPTMVEDPKLDVVEVDFPPDPEPVKPEPKVEVKTPEPPTPPAQDPVATQEFKVPTPSPDAADTTTIKDVSDLTKNPGLKDSDGTGRPEDIDSKPKPPGTGTGEGDGGPITVDVTDPKYWETVQPTALNLDDIKRGIRYPAPLKEVGLEGEVQLKVLVDEKGNYLRHEVRKSTHKLFTDEVEGKVKGLKFTPGRQGEKDVRVWVIIPFKFKLNR